MSLDAAHDAHKKLKKAGINHILFANHPGGQVQIFLDINEISEYDQYIDFLSGVCVEMEKELENFEKFVMEALKKEKARKKRKISQ